MKLFVAFLVLCFLAGMVERPTSHRQSRAMVHRRHDS
jgi:hypothetical protein